MVRAVHLVRYLFAAAVVGLLVYAFGPLVQSLCSR